MKIFLSLTATCGLLALVGCSQSATSSVDGSKYLLSEEPAGATDVIKVREVSKDGDDVVIVGRIGGGKDPWVKGVAAFHIVDDSLRSCSDRPGDNCPIPWDYCCETAETLAASKALVKVVDETGAMVKADARELLNVKELSTVVVKGKAQRDEAGNLVVLANSIYVKK